MSYRRVRRDANHADIVRAFRALGWYVEDTAKMGAGFPDLLVLHPARDPQGPQRYWSFVEVKTAEGLKGRSGNPETRQRQADFASRWPVVVVSSVEEIAQL